ncbi:NusG domain II-containing protein [Clostridium sp. cel8]|uniref:NusG domain II-containing protein n=1 Tax=Clostridium sp. cel8 TaxID=2663123 RepID=UPI0015F54997|nr:NusG domain II-containing protein [Clostridium sp. cel8]MBA5850294.1 NusG domain II-containing protein [Clostridium sp. cel8]
MKKVDKIIVTIIALLILSSIAGVFIYINHFKGTEKIAIIKQNTKVIKTIDLNKIDKPEEFTIKFNNTNYNKIRVEKGRICIIDADCPNKICVKSGWISKSGETIVCLPHKLQIEIEGTNENYDNIAR